MPLISVVIITYNRELSVLKRAIDSVLRQTYTNLEVIIVNDAPENISLATQIVDFINKLNDKRVHYIPHKTNQGANAARNTGLYAAKGEYIAFLDDDDEWLPEKLNIQLSYFTQPEIALVSCGFKIQTPTDGFDRFPPTIKRSPLESILIGNFIGSTSFPLLRRKAVLDVQGFDPQVKSCQEYDLWIRLLVKYSMTVCPQILGIYYISADSTFKNDIHKFLAGYEYIEQKYQTLFRQYPKIHHESVLNMFLNLVRAKEYKNALLYKWKAWKIDCWNMNNILPVFILRMWYGKHCQS